MHFFFFIFFQKIFEGYRKRWVYVLKSIKGYLELSSNAICTVYGMNRKKMVGGIKLFLFIENKKLKILLSWLVFLLAVWMFDKHDVRFFGDTPFFFFAFFFFPSPTSLNKHVFKCFPFLFPFSYVAQHGKFTVKFRTGRKQ